MREKNPVQWRSFVLLHTPFKAPFTCQFIFWFSALGLLTHTAQWCTWGNREERGLIRSGAWCWPQARDSEHVKWERKPPARGWKQRCKSRKQENIQTQNKILFLRFVILHCPQTMSTVNQQKSERLFPFTTEPSVYTKDEYSKQHKPLDCVSSGAPIVLHFLALNVMEASE